MIVGILAAVALPQYFRIIEKGRFSLAKEWVLVLQGAQEHYILRPPYAYYAGAVGPNIFDVNLGPLSGFNAGNITAAAGPSWTITVTRAGPCPPVYGCYTATYDSATSLFTSPNADVTDDLIP